MNGTKLPDNFPFLARKTWMDFLMVSSDVPGGKSVTNFFTSISCLAVFAWGAAAGVGACATGGGDWGTVGGGGGGVAANCGGGDGAVSAVNPGELDLDGFGWQNCQDWKFVLWQTFRIGNVEEKLVLIFGRVANFQDWVCWVVVFRAYLFRQEWGCIENLPWQAKDRLKFWCGAKR